MNKLYKNAEFYVKMLDFFVKKAIIKVPQTRSGSPHRHIFGLFLCLFDILLRRHTIIMLIIAETVRDSVRTRAPLLGSGSSFGFFLFIRLKIPISRRRYMKNAERTVKTARRTESLKKTVKGKNQELTFDELEARTDSIARDVYDTALIYKDDAVGLYGAIMYAAIKILVKTERLAEPKTEAERLAREKQVSFITDLIYKEHAKRGLA